MVLKGLLNVVGAPGVVADSCVTLSSSVEQPIMVEEGR
jgi:hypothetical protein